MARADFDFDSSFDDIVKLIKIAHKCPYYDNIEVDLTKDCSWHDNGSMIPFDIENLPVARARWTNSLDWVQERMQGAERAREWREDSPAEVEVVTAAPDTNNNGGGGGETGREGATSHSREGAVVTTPENKSSGKEGGTTGGEPQGKSG